jgi:type II secretory ATPase GspE/PulE/Tfp pilus assembly ATPase PilB-like protein
MERYVGPVETLYRPRGCSRCRNRGYTGRIGIYELLVPDDVMFERISQGAALNELRDLAKTVGLKPLRADGVEKVKAGLTTLDEVYRVSA